MLSIFNSKFSFCLRMESSNTQYEAMRSVAKAASHLLRHLLNVHELAVRKRIQVVSGIFTLLDQSLLLAKSSSFTNEFVPNPPEDTESKVEACKEIFQAALDSLHGALEKQFCASLFHVSANWCHEEFQVTL